LNHWLSVTPTKYFNLKTPRSGPPRWFHHIPRTAFTEPPVHGMVPNMDRSCTVADLKRMIQSFCENRDWDQYHTPKELAIGVVTEAGELLDKFRFLSDEQIAAILDSEKRIKVEHELADVLFFILRFAQRFEIDLDDALRAKLEINARKYPVEKARGNNLKSTEY
jgi:NTP pyrophosphatase (non-canonical NTP hydrolase)